MATDFPTVDRNRLVSKASKTLLDQVCPASWHVTEVSGDSDFGLDLMVQLEVDGGICHLFHIQLKGSESLELIGNGSAISYPLKRTTLNYYASIETDVMLAVAEVVLDEAGKLVPEQSKVYWQWMSTELTARRGGSFELDLSSAKTTSVHVPVEQVLHARLDVRGHLEQQRAIASAGASLENILRQSMSIAPGDRPYLARLEHKARQQPSAFSMLLQAEGDISLDVLPPIANEIRGLLRAGNTAQAEAALERLGPGGFGSEPVQKAAYSSLQGKALMQRWRRDEALVMFKQAYEEVDSPEHLLALAETRFLLAVDSSDRDEIRDVASLLKDIETDEGLSLRVRVHIALEDVPEAESCLSRIAGVQKKLSHLVLLSLARNWDEAKIVLTELESEASRSPEDLTRARLIGARTAWWAATESFTSEQEGVDEMPLSGAVGTRIDFAEDAWSLGLKALEGLKALGWPPNVEHLAPTICGVAGVLGQQRYALELLGEAAALRPEYQELQHNFELLAIGAGQLEKALAANRRQHISMDVLIRRTSVLFELDQYAECVRTALEITRSTEKPTSRSPMALALGYAAAHKIGRHVDAATFKDSLEANPEWGEYLCFAEVAKLSSLRADEAKILSVLREGVEHHPDSRLLVANLYSNLDVGQSAAAEEAVDLAKRLRRRALLSLEDVLRLVAAHTTLKQWSEAANEVADGLERFNGNEQLLAMGAVAQEMMGRTGAALCMLEGALAAGTSRISVVHNYMGLVLRLGRIDAVRTAIDRLLELTTDRVRRLELLRLSTLIYVQEGNYLAAHAAAEALGQQVDQSNEHEEGVFLNVVMAVMLQGPPLKGSFHVAFRQRVDIFCSKWPESRLFRRATLSEGKISGLDSLHQLLDPIVGDSRARMREFEKRERQAKRGEFPVPFVVRPGFVLHYIGDPFALWDVAVRSKSEDRHFHLEMAGADDEPKSPNPTRDTPLLDLTALLVLEALGLFDELFGVFKRVAISRRTVGFVSQHANSLLDRGLGMARAKAILAFINKWLDRIDQPGEVEGRRAGVAITSGDALLEYMDLAKRGWWLVYSDDAICRRAIHEGGSEARFCSTLDVLELLDGEGLLTAPQIASKLAALTRWNVGIRVADRYLLAALSGSLPDQFRGDTLKRLNAFQSHDLFTTLSRAVWHPGKSASNLVLHMAQLLRSMLHHPDSQVESVAAVLACWFIRVQLLQQGEPLGWKLICYPTMLALNVTSDEGCARLVEVVQQAVAVSVGEQRMSVRIEGDVAGELGAVVASVAQRDAKLGDELLRKLLHVMPSGTAMGDRCFEGYTAELKVAFEGEA